MQTRHFRSLHCELLEQRHLLAADLVIEDVFLVNSANVPISAPVYGEETFVRATWTTTDLHAGDAYIVRFQLDGVPLDSRTLFGETGKDLSFQWYIGGWYASPGVHVVEVTLDATHRITEDDEANNTFSIAFSPLPPTSLPQLFVAPIEGQQSLDWTILNYADVDPTSNVADYRGRGASYNGHDAIDFTLATFARMDEGVQVFAAADGVVVEAEDGHFDRQTDWISPSPPVNYIVIDHGAGWRTEYLHLRRDTLLVAPGDVVVAGQPLALVGSSGVSTGPHLHFRVEHDGAAVETYFAPDYYWSQPLPYTFDAITGTLDAGITNREPDYAMLLEQVSNIDSIAATPFQPVYAWTILASLRQGDVYGVRFMRPDGTVYRTNSLAAAQEYPWSWWWFSTTLPSVPDIGTWRIEYFVGGRVLAEREFFVGRAEPEMTVHLNNTYIIDGRSTPIDFGSVRFGSSGPLRRFSVENHGDAPLDVSGVSLPSGFSLVESVSSSIAPGNSDTFVVRLESNVAGAKRGTISLLSNDTSESRYDFAVEGVVRNSPLAGDYNGNGLVEQADLDLVLLHWGADATTPPPSWINHLPRTRIDQEELDAVLLRWGESLAAAGLEDAGTAAASTSAAARDSSPSLESPTDADVPSFRSGPKRRASLRNPETADTVFAAIGVELHKRLGACSACPLPFRAKPP